MKVISFNANGIRAAAKKGFFSWFIKQKADILCIQETKAKLEQLKSLKDNCFFPKNYNYFYFDAEKKGYSGVAIYSKHKPISVKTGLGFNTADLEGRYIEIEFKNIIIASIYIPSGTSGPERQDLKFKFLDKYLKILKKQLNQKKDFIIAGDWNIAHQKIDIKNWQANQNSSGFLPEERAWLDKVFYKLGYIDTFRQKHPKKVMYTWWSNRARAWENNVGWRLDYQIVTPRLSDKIKKASSYRDKKFSDHAPFIVNYDLEIKE